MSRAVKPAAARFYVDADVLELAKILVQVRKDVTYPGDPGGVLFRRARPACVVTSPEVLDPVWIPEVTQQGWLIITRDANNADNRAETDAVRTAGARMVALAGKDAIGTRAQLEVLLSRWREIEALLSQPGPFIYSATRTRLRHVPLA